MQIQKRRLGRGLAALIGDDVSEDSFIQDVKSLRHLPVEVLHPNPNNPRKHFAESDIEDLARSIKDKGLLQPLVVRPKGGGVYEIVAGERRWRAAQRAQVHDVPVLIRELTDQETLEIAIVENVQRSDLSALEEAQAYKMLVDQYGYTQQQLADSVGKSRSHISNTMRLMTLPASVIELLESGKITAGHARTLVATDNPQEIAERIVAMGLSVREAEDYSRPKNSATKPQKDADTRAMEKTMTDALGMSVTIQHRRDKGSVTISYRSLDQLDHLFRKLTS